MWYIMSLDHKEKIASLQQQIFAHSTATLYGDTWGDSLPASLEATPILTWKKLIECPFRKRTYTAKPLFVHITYRDSEACLIGRTTSDILSEHYGDTTVARPLVAAHYRHHAIEKGMWFYEHNILPQIALENVDATLAIAKM